MRHGEAMRHVKTRLRVMKPEDRFKSKELALDIAEEVGCPVSSFKVAVCLSKLKDNDFVKRIYVPMGSDDWQVQSKVIML